MIEKATIVIKGKEYAFLKPAPIDIVEIERKSFIDGKFNTMAYEDALLAIVSKDIKKDDLVTFNGKEIELSSGVKLIPQQMPFSQYEKMLDGAQNDTVTKSINNYLAICGNTKLDVRSLTKDDVYNLYEAYMSLYDRQELDEVLEKLNSFC